MRIDVLTLFPDVFDNLNSFSIIKKAIDSKKVEINTHNLRDYADNSRKVDDYPYGGFPGMVIKIEPIDNCIESLKKKNNYDEIILIGSGKWVASVKTINQVAWKRRDLKQFKRFLKYYHSAIKNCKDYNFY